MLITGPVRLELRQEGTYIASVLPPTPTLPLTFTWSNGTVGSQATYNWPSPGTYHVGVTATNACGSRSGTLAVSVIGRIYLPLVINWWNPCFLGPGGFWEHEPNNYWSEANGPLCPDVVYGAEPSDADDLFTFDSGAGAICVYVDEYAPGCKGGLALYDADYRQIGTTALCGGSGSLCTDGIAGRYYMRIYTAETSTTPYRLWATFPRR